MSKRARSSSNTASFELDQKEGRITDGVGEDDLYQRKEKNEKNAAMSSSLRLAPSPLSRARSNTHWKHDSSVESSEKQFFILLQHDAGEVGIPP